MMNKPKTAKEYTRLSIKNKTLMYLPRKNETNVFEIPLSYLDNITGEITTHINTIKSPNGSLGPTQTSKGLKYDSEYVICELNEGETLEVDHTEPIGCVTLVAVKIRNDRLMLVDKRILEGVS